MEPKEAAGVLALVVALVLVVVHQFAVAIALVGTVGIWAFTGKPRSAPSRANGRLGKRRSLTNARGVSSVSGVVMSSILLAPLVLGFAIGDSGTNTGEEQTPQCDDCQYPKVNLKRNTFDVRRTLYNVPDCAEFGWGGEPYYDLENGTTWKDYTWNAYGVVLEATKFSSWEEAINTTDHIYVKFKGEDYKAEVTFELAELTNTSAVIYLELWVETSPGDWEIVISVKDGEIIEDSGTIVIEPESVVPVDIRLAAKNIPTADGSEMAEPTQIVFAWEEWYRIIH